MGGFPHGLFFKMGLLLETSNWYPGVSVFFCAEIRKSLSVGGLEDHLLILGTLGEGNAELEELDDHSGEVLEEEIVVGGILLDPGLELLVLDESHVGGKHHEGLGLLVLILLGAIPLLPLPLLVEKELVVVVGQDGGGEGPGAVVTAAVGMAASKGVGTRQSDDLLVVEAHAVEDVAEVVLALGSIGETAIRSAGSDIPVGATRAEGDVGAQHLLDSADAGKNPEIRVGDPGKLGYCQMLEKLLILRSIRHGKTYP